MAGVHKADKASFWCRLRPHRPWSGHDSAESSLGKGKLQKEMLPLRELLAASERVVDVVGVHVCLCVRVCMWREGRGGVGVCVVAQ